MEVLKYGIDISEHNGNVDLNPFKDNFVIIRVAYGTNMDKQAKRNMDLCEQLGIPYGVYLYSYALSVSQAEDEANYLLNAIKGRKFEYPVWYDMEDADGYKARNNALNGKLMTDMCNKFCSIVGSRGYYVGVYASESWFNGYLKGLGNYDKWVASWGINNGHVNRDTSNMGGMLQYSSVAYGKLDGNVSYYDYPSIIHKKGLNGYGNGGSAPKPQPPKKSTEQIANDIMNEPNYGGWGTGEERKNKLANAGYSFDQVQAIINKKSGISSTPKPTPIKVGDKVTPIKPISYDGVKCWDEITKHKYTVIEVKGKRVVLGDDLNTAFNIDNLKK